MGKTCLVLRYVEGSFSKDITSTIGAFFLSKKVNLNGESIKLQIWDTAGQERFRAMAPMYYRSSNAAILVFDVTSPASFGTLKHWVSELQSNNMETIVMSIACNKVDLGRRKVSAEEVHAYCKSIGAESYDTSAKSGKGVDELFRETVENIQTLAAAHASDGHPLSRQVHLGDSPARCKGARRGERSDGSCC